MSYSITIKDLIDIVFQYKKDSNTSFVSNSAKAPHLPEEHSHSFIDIETGLQHKVEKTDSADSTDSTDSTDTSIVVNIICL